MVEEKIVALTDEDVLQLKGNAKQMLIAAIIFSVFIEIIGLTIYFLLNLIIPFVIAFILSSFLIVVVFIYLRKGSMDVQAGTKTILQGKIDNLTIQQGKNEVYWEKVGVDKVNIMLQRKSGSKYDLQNIELSSRKKDPFFYFIIVGVHKIPVNRPEFFKFKKLDPVTAELTKSGKLIRIY